jgi:phosphatidylglycerol:prolipoprotein diacylglycerol transferase
MFPILFRIPLPGIGPITIHTYGALLIVAFLVAITVARRLAKREQIDADRIVDLGVYAILGGLVGAKVLLLIVDRDFYSRQFSSILAEGGGSVGETLSGLGRIGAFIGTIAEMAFSLLQAGGVFYGGLIAGVAVALWYMRRTGLPLWRAADVTAPAIAIAHAFGRVGCFAAGCCYGIPTELPWGTTFTNSYSGTLVGVPLNIALHPTQLYSVLGNLFIFGMLMWFYKRKQFNGQVFWVYALSYGIFRFVVEFWRGDPRGSLFGGALSTSQFVAIVMVTVALGMLARLRMNNAPDAAEGSA